MDSQEESVIASEHAQVRTDVRMECKRELSVRFFLVRPIKDVPLAIRGCVGVLRIFDLPVDHVNKKILDAVQADALLRRRIRITLGCRPGHKKARKKPCQVASIVVEGSVRDP